MRFLAKRREVRHDDAMAQVPTVLHTDKVLVGVFVFSGTKTCSYDVVDFRVTLGLGLRNLQLHGRDLVGFDIRADAKEFPVYLHKMGYGTTELSYAKNGNGEIGIFGIRLFIASASDVGVEVIRAEEPVKVVGVKCS